MSVKQVAGQMPQELATLHDIHLPEGLSWWPWAPGWYGVAVLLCLGSGLLTAWLIYFYLNSRAKRQALRLLANYQHQKVPSQISAARVSELLKRVALIYFPRRHVASLQGDAWITFLNETSKGLDFNCIRHDLLEIPYQPTVEKDLFLLFDMAKRWIKQRRGRCLN